MKLIRSQIATDYPVASVWRFPSGNCVSVVSADVRYVSGLYVSDDQRKCPQLGEPVTLSLRFMKRFARRVA